MSGKTLTGEVLQSLMSFPSAQPLGLGLSFPFLAFRAFAHRAFTALRPISLGSAIILSHKLGIGQHRDQSGGAPNSGQKNIRGTAGDVGNMSGGRKNNGPVPASRPGSDISTTTGVGRAFVAWRTTRRRR